MTTYIQRVDGDPRLVRRGIDRVLHQAQWRCGTYNYHGTSLDGWYAPLFDAAGKRLHNPTSGKLIRAWKNASKESDQPHDLWSNYPQGLKPYILPPQGIKSLVKQANGVLYGAEGKADTATLWAAGCWNTAGFFGKSMVPDTLREELLDWGVKHFIYYCHPDAVDVAQKIVNRLQDSGVAVIIYLLPTDEQGNKIDLNDLWQQVLFNQLAFQTKLIELQRLDLKPEQLKHHERKPFVKAVALNCHYRLRRWADRALANIEAEVANAAPGYHFDALKRAANRLGTIAAHGLLDRHTCEEAIIAACYRNKYLPKHGEYTTRKRFTRYFESGLKYPQDANLPEIQEQQPTQIVKSQRPILPNANSSPDQPSACWPETLPDQLRQGILTCCGKQGHAIAQVVQAIIETFGTDDFNLQEFSKRTGIPYQTAWRAMEVYGVHEVMEIAAPTAENSSMSRNFADQTIYPQVGSNHAGISQSPSGKKGKRYGLCSYRVFVDWLLRRFIKPYYEQQMIKRTAGLSPEVSLELLRLLDEGVDQGAVDTIASRLDAVRTEQRKKQLRQAWKAVLDQYQSWQQRLQDMTCTPLPKTPDGRDWNEDYIGAVVMGAVSPYLGKKQLPLNKVVQVTGLSRSTVRRTYDRLGIANDPQWHPTGQIVTIIDELPELGYDPRYDGAPEHIIFETGKVLDYRDEAVRERARQAVRAGEKVRIGYRQAGVPRLMTAEERQARRDEQATKSSRKQHENKHYVGRISQPPHVGPGHSPQFAWQAARGWVAELGYGERADRVLHRDEIVADRPFDQLSGCELIRLLLGETLIMISTGDELLDYCLHDLGMELESIVNTDPILYQQLVARLVD